jgi:hypothetical protein
MGGKFGFIKARQQMAACVKLPDPPFEDAARKAAGLSTQTSALLGACFVTIVPSSLRRFRILKPVCNVGVRGIA